jgi:SM-20-related protein
MSGTLFALNPALDPDALARRYAEHSRLQIVDILTHDAAEAVRDVLERQTPWGMAYAGGDTTGSNVPLDILRTMPPAARQALIQQAGEAVRRGEFGFVYSQYPMVEAYLNRWNPGHPLELLLEHMNDDAMLALIRRVTGIHGLIKADAQATLYGPGHYLAQHDDSISGDGRRVAYVLNLARDWRPDWGGYLLFYDEAGDVTGGFRPRFNALSLFTVPQRHAVSYVPPFAPIDRFAVTGWFRDR